MALRQRGLRTTAAFVALGRKLARVCFALLKKGTEFNPELRARGGASTWKLTRPESNDRQCALELQGGVNDRHR